MCDLEPDDMRMCLIDAIADNVGRCQGFPECLESRKEFAGFDVGGLSFEDMLGIEPNEYDAAMDRAVSVLGFMCIAECPLRKV